MSRPRIDPALIAACRRILDRARLIAEASAAQASEVGHGTPSDRPPPGAFTGQSSTLEACARRIVLAIATGQDAEVLAAIAWCESELELIQRGAPDRHKESEDLFAERVIRDYAGLSVAEVVRREHGTTYPKRVVAIREAAGRDRMGRRIDQAA